VVAGVVTRDSLDVRIEKVFRCLLVLITELLKEQLSVEKMNGGLRNIFLGLGNELSTYRTRCTRVNRSVTIKQIHGLITV